MNELCNNFELYSISKVESVDGNTIVLKAGAVPVKLVADSVELNPSSTTGTSGTLITLESEMLVEKVTTEVAIRYANARKAVLVFKKISGEIALSGFDLAAGGTIVLKLGSDRAAAEVSIAYTAGATLADVASAINAKLKGGTPNYSSTDYGGWAATAADNFVVMGSNTYNASRPAIAVVDGWQTDRKDTARPYLPIDVDGGVDRGGDRYRLP